MKFHKILYILLISLISTQQAIGYSWTVDRTDQSITIPGGPFTRIEWGVGKAAFRFRNVHTIKDSVEHFQETFSNTNLATKTPEELKALFADYFAIPEGAVSIVDNRSFSEKVSAGLKGILETGKNAQAYCINFYSQNQETLKGFEPYAKDGFCALVIIGGAVYLLHKTGILKTLSEHKALSASALSIGALTAYKYFGLEAIKAVGLKSLVYATNPYVAAGVGLTALAVAGFYKKIGDFIQNHPTLRNTLICGAVGLQSYFHLSQKSNN